MFLARCSTTLLSCCVHPLRTIAPVLGCTCPRRLYAHDAHNGLKWGEQDYKNNEWRKEWPSTQRRTTKLGSPPPEPTNGQREDLPFQSKVHAERYVEEPPSNMFQANRKLWIEGLPIAAWGDLHRALDGALNSTRWARGRLDIEDVEFVADRGLMPTFCAFVNVNFGDNELERVINNLESSGVFVAGIRCPVRSAEVKRTLVMNILEDKDEEEVINDLNGQELNYVGLHYAPFYITPLRNNQRAHRSKLALTFASHDDAYSAMAKFKSARGVKIGEKRIQAFWQSRLYGTRLRMAVNFMRHMQEEVTRLREYIHNLWRLNPDLKTHRDKQKLLDRFTDTKQKRWGYVMRRLRSTNYVSERGSPTFADDKMSANMEQIIEDVNEVYQQKKKQFRSEYLEQLDLLKLKLGEIQQLPPKIRKKKKKKKTKNPESG